MKRAAALLLLLVCGCRDLHVHIHLPPKQIVQQDEATKPGVYLHVEQEPVCDPTTSEPGEQPSTEAELLQEMLK
jgi:hypothetical protein